MGWREKSNRRDSSGLRLRVAQVLGFAIRGEALSQYTPRAPRGSPMLGGARCTGCGRPRGATHANTLVSLNRPSASAEVAGRNVHWALSTMTWLPGGKNEGNSYPARGRR